MAPIREAMGVGSDATTVTRVFCRHVALPQVVLESRGDAAVWVGIDTPPPVGSMLRAEGDSRALRVTHVAEVAAPGGARGFAAVWVDGSELVTSARVGSEHLAPLSRESDPPSGGSDRETAEGPASGAPAERFTQEDRQARQGSDEEDEDPSRPRHRRRGRV